MRVDWLGDVVLSPMESGDAFQQTGTDTIISFHSRQSKRVCRRANNGRVAKAGLVEPGRSVPLV